jgi:hypothetical protein
MSKIVQAVNAMISNPKFISNVKEGGHEIFFIYKNKYIWSIKNDGSVHHLWYYPGSLSLDRLIELATREIGWDEVMMVHYSDADIGTKEAKASFSELFTLIKEKLYGVNDMLDDIISDLDDSDDPPF